MEAVILSTPSSARAPPSRLTGATDWRPFPKDALGGKESLKEWSSVATSCQARQVIWSLDTSQPRMRLQPVPKEPVLQKNHRCWLTWLLSRKEGYLSGRSCLLWPDSKTRRRSSSGGTGLSRAWLQPSSF